ncbi:NUDIX domain-containing protein [Paenibacillus sp. FSL M7-0134]|uniref:NUDIX domain-containing protein n=1 Tax=Paenibacillus sp. FSL M7-0134 TaxID=2954754 RepID=UPI0030F9231A
MSRIQQAINFVIREVEAPALDHPELEKEFKNKVIRSRTVVRNMKRVGDLKRYLQRFEIVQPSSSPGTALYERFKNLGLETYEDLYPRFCEEFKDELDDVTVLNDFVIGADYTSWDISILARTYDPQSGIYLIGNNDRLQAIFIKSTFSDGKYPNEWIVENEKIKYYFYSLRGNFDPNYKYNASIINSAQNKTPIYLFTKDGTVLNLNGLYEFESHHYNSEDGSRWFILNKLNSLNMQSSVTTKEYLHEVDKQVKKAKRSTDQDRKARLNNAPKKPESVPVITTAYKRNPDVIVEVLKRANGICEICYQPAPFLRASDLSPYLEVHHEVPLADGGDDTVENAFAVCPNCHREEHFGVQAKIVTAALIVDRGKILIAKRGKGMKLEGKWEFPGGKLEAGESFEECLKREIYEELGMHIDVIHHFDNSIYKYSDGVIKLIAYWAKWSGGEIVVNEHSEIKWIDFADLGLYDFSPADIPFIGSLRNYNNFFTTE